MEVISGPVDHGTARTLEGKLIRQRLDQARLDGVIDGTEHIEVQLARAGLLNKNRGREKDRWVDDVETEDHIVNSLNTFNIRTPKSE